jgi:hypothetical protein
VNAGQVVPLPSAVDRQSKQIYLAPSQFYNYYDPGFQYQMLIPTEIDNSKLTSAGNRQTATSIIPYYLNYQNIFTNDVCLSLSN